MVETLEQLADRLKAEFASAASSLAFGELTLTVEAKDILRVLAYLRDDPECQFTILIDICGVDYPNRPRRFDVVYHLLSIAKNKRIRIKVETEETAPVASIVSVHPAANWFEREAFDMFGIEFKGHPNLRRILMEDDWEGHPLRKDYPIGGEPVRFSGEE